MEYTCLRSCLASDCLALEATRMNLGIANAASIPMMTTTIINSIRVNPADFFLFCPFIFTPLPGCLRLKKRGGWRTIPLLAVLLVHRIVDGAEQCAILVNR